MDMERFVRCGEVLVNSDRCDVVCDTQSGDCVLRDETNGDYVIAEITTVNPLYMDSKACEKLCSTLGVEGIIATNDYLYAVSNGTVKALEYGTNECKAEFPFNTDIVYEGEIDE